MTHVRKKSVTQNVPQTDIDVRISRNINSNSYLTIPQKPRGKMENIK